MTDLEEWRAFLAKFGITPVEGPASSRDRSRDIGKTAATSFTIYAEDNDRTIGYGGFYTEVEFDKDGKFLCLGVWE